MVNPPNTATLSWMDESLCRQVDPELFFPESGANSTHIAKGVCMKCDVRRECLEYALSMPGMTGVFGATTEGERAKIRARRKGRRAA